MSFLFKGAWDDLYEIRINDPIDYSDHEVSKEWMKTTFAKIHQFPNLMPQIDPSDLGSLILVCIIPNVNMHH